MRSTTYIDFQRGNELVKPAEQAPYPLDRGQPPKIPTTTMHRGNFAFLLSVCYPAVYVSVDIFVRSAPPAVHHPPLDADASLFNIFNAQVPLLFGDPHRGVKPWGTSSTYLTYSQTTLQLSRRVATALFFLGQWRRRRKGRKFGRVRVGSPPPSRKVDRAYANCNENLPAKGLR